jgi:hypothetical protein
MNVSVPVQTASALIDEKIKGLGDWRGKALARVRKLVHEADPEIVEEWKWMGTPVFSRGGIVCTGETYEKIVKMTFPRGVALQDPSGLFNSSLDGNVRRAIDIHEGDKIDEAALKDLIRAAVALNLVGKSKSEPRRVGSKRAAGKATAACPTSPGGGRKQNLPMARRITSIDEYLATVRGERRTTLETLRETIRSIVPKAEECISYGIPAFRLHGSVVAGFCATAKGCSYFPFSGSTLETLARHLSGYEQNMSSLHFSPDKSLPVTLVRRLIKARIGELEK